MAVQAVADPDEAGKSACLRERMHSVNILPGCIYQDPERQGKVVIPNEAIMNQYGSELSLLVSAASHTLAEATKHLTQIFLLREGSPCKQPTIFNIFYLCGDAAVSISALFGV